MNISIILGLEKYSLFLSLFLLSLTSLFTFNKKHQKVLTILNYSLLLVIFVHLVSIVLFKYVNNSVLDPFNVFVDVCVMCPDKYEYAINFARIAFYLQGLNTFLFLVKSKYKLIDRYYKYKDLLNFIVFYSFSIYVHTINSLFHVNTTLYSLFWIAQIVTTIKLFFRIKTLF